MNLRQKLKNVASNADLVRELQEKTTALNAAGAGNTTNLLNSYSLGNKNAINTGGVLLHGTSVAKKAA